MNPIRAFVGHSFTAEDETVVRAFADYFDTLAESLPSFMWQDAERAEPNTLTDKVLRIVKDKNLFIGICTSKEQAVLSKALSVAWPWRSYLRAKANQFSSKTSDWIIQEIGMAIGMGMKTILLVEKGLRGPGGLQGNTEYIEFDRNNPSKSFPKILQMISAISPKESTALTTTTTESASPEKVDEPDAEANITDLTMPDKNWDRRMYEFAISRAIYQKDDATISRIDTEYRRTHHSTVPENENSWEAHIEVSRLRSGHEGRLDRLIGLAEKNPHNSMVKESLARGYIIYKEHALAASTFVEASEAVANDPKRRARLLKSASEQYVLDRQFEKAKELACLIRETVKESPANEITLLQTLNSIARAEKDDRLQVTTMERIVELKPDDIDARFHLALKQSELGNGDLALKHYLHIPLQERSSSAWNNIGVEFDRFSLPSKAVDAFSQAADEGETLALSNLGNKFISQGFIVEARALCERALSIGNPHNNIHDLLSRLNEMPELEQQREDEILLASQTKGNFYRAAGRAIAGEDGTEESIRNTWVASDCSLQVSKGGNTIQFVGTFEREQSLLVGLLSGLGNPYGNSPPTPPKKIKHYVQYDGKFEGRVFFGNVQRKSDGQTLASGAGAEKEVIMVLAPDQSRLDVIEDPKSDKPEFYTLKRAS